eukprot:GSMAST32.ASY1.ANO1.604.1 assembled CDS
MSSVCFYTGAFTLGMLLVTVIFSVLSYLRRLLHFKHLSYRGKHVLVTGGSTGIGKCVATEFARRGANVTLLARTESKLIAAVKDISDMDTKQPTIRYVCADVTDEGAVHEAVKQSVTAANGQDIDVLIACAGASYPGYFLDQDTDVFERSMRLNYLGSVTVIKAVAPQMCKRGQGHIVLVASAAAVVSFIGYSTYAPTKFALRGLADTLRNELIGFGVKVSIAYPPDTDTPGFENENKSKPAETKAVSPPEVWPATAVARSLVSSMASGDYHLSSPDFVQNLLVSTMAGVTPRKYLLLECFLQPILGIVEWLFLWHADREAYKYGCRISLTENRKKVSKSSTLKSE